MNCIDLHPLSRNRAKYLRQTLVFADFLTPEFNALFNKHMKNVSGKLKVKHTYEEGSIMDVIPQVQQVIDIFTFDLRFVTDGFFSDLTELYSYRRSFFKVDQRCTLQVLY